MNAAEFTAELLFPLRSAGVLIAMATFGVLLTIAALAGLLGVWLFVVVLAALARYLVLVAEARARDRDADPPGAEYFSLVGNAWTLWPALLVFAIGVFAEAAHRYLGPWPAVATVAVALFFLPASIGVLTMTRAPVESVKPWILYDFVAATRSSYAYPLIAGAAVVAPPWLAYAALPAFVLVFLELYLLTAFFAVIGGVVRSADLLDGVEIEPPTEPDEETVATGLLRRRTAVLNHAYGFASRGNREGALQHIALWIGREDPDPRAARAWFFDGMLTWEDPNAALVFAQRWLGILLATGESVQAVKLLLRCRLINPRFRPATEDVERAVAAAEACDNAELASALRRL